VGTAPPFLRQFATYWAERFAFDAFADELVQQPHFVTDIDGQAVHFVHMRSADDDAPALLAIHGWPSSFMEYTALADELPFHVVIPSLPGFVFSGAPEALDGYAASSMASTWAALMTRLGYPRFVVTGGDIGARVATWLGARFADQVMGLHVSSNVLHAIENAPDRDGVVRELQPHERGWIAARNAWMQPEGAYMHLHQTKPATLAPALSDSPIGLASWVIEKWQAWGTTDVTQPARMEHLARLCTLYALTNCAPRSILPYYAYERAGGARAPAETIEVPVAFYLSAGEIGGIPPRSLAERRYNLRQWTVLEDGGHFAALDAPTDFVHDLQRFGARLVQ
jgi:pimeloyl-ACP methyl ester carboxylesterase